MEKLTGDFINLLKNCSPNHSGIRYVVLEERGQALNKTLKPHRLVAKGFAATNIVLGVGSFTYQFNTRDTLGFAAKGSWFEVNSCDDVCNKTNCACDNGSRKAYNIYKDPITDDGTKKSLKGLVLVAQDDFNEYFVLTEVSEFEENQGVLETIYEDGTFYNQTTLTEIRSRLK
jgi:nicotinamide phosphoribosyltransferase